MKNPKRTVAAALLCLCIIPLFAVAVSAQSLNDLKEKLETEMTETRKAVKGKAGLMAEAQRLDDEVRQLKSTMGTQDNLDELEERAKELIGRAVALRARAETPQGASFEGQNDDVPSRDQVEQRKRVISKQVDEAVEAALAAANPVAADSESLRLRVGLLIAQRERFVSISSRTKTVPQLADLEREGTALTNEANNVKAEAESLKPGVLDSIFSPTGLLTIALSLLAVGALAALLYAGWLVFKLNRRVGDLENLHVKVVQRFKTLEGVLGEQKAYAQDVNSGVKRLREEMSREMEEVRRSYRDMRAGPARPVAATADSYGYVGRAPTRDHGPTFPSLVSDYLSKVSESKKLEVEADFRTNLFVPAPGGPFVLVQDDDGTGSGIVLPKSRLQKSQEFISYYKGTYYCDSPSAGDVFVVEPAVVDNAGGGWRLRSPGRLELR